MKDNHNLIKIDFDKLIEIFNTGGKEAAKTFVESEYNSSYAFIQRRIKKETNYFFNRNTRRYEIREKTQPGFMTLEELYEGNSKPEIPLNNYAQKVHIYNEGNDTFKDLVLNLMKDKMQELSKYIHLEQSTMQVIIDLKKLEQSGYRVVIN